MAVREQCDVASHEPHGSLAFDGHEAAAFRDQVVGNHPVRFDSESAGDFSGRRGNDRPRRFQVGVDEHRPRHTKSSQGFGQDVHKFRIPSRDRRISDQIQRTFSLTLLNVRRPFYAQRGVQSAGWLWTRVSGLTC